MNVARLLSICLVGLLLSFADDRVHAEPETTHFDNGRLISESGDPALHWKYVPAEDGTSETLQIETIYDLYGDPYPEYEYRLDRRPAVDWDPGRVQVHRGDGSRYTLDTQRTFERWSLTESDENSLVTDAQSAWVDADTGEAILMETARVLVYDRDINTRYIDFRVRFVNVSLATIQIPALDDTGGRIRLNLDPTATNLEFMSDRSSSQRIPFSVSTPWLAWTLISPSEIRPIGLAIFSEGQTGALDSVRFSVDSDGVVSVALQPARGEFVLAPEDFVEFEFRIFCYLGAIPKRIVSSEYEKYAVQAP